MYKLRTDGFISLSCGLQTGTVLTKTLSRRRCGLELNLSTSAGGFFQLEVCGENANAIPGFTFKDMEPFWGGRSWEPEWKGGKFSNQPGGRFRLRLRMKECGLFSIHFPKE